MRKISETYINNEELNYYMNELRENYKKNLQPTAGYIIYYLACLIILRTLHRRPVDLKTGV